MNRYYQKKNIKILVKTLNINKIYNNHIKNFEADYINLNKVIDKIDEIKLNINKNINLDKTIKIEEEKMLIKINKIYFFIFINPI